MKKCHQKCHHLKTGVKTVNLLRKLTSVRGGGGGGTPYTLYIQSSVNNIHKIGAIF